MSRPEERAGDGPRPPMGPSEGKDRDVLARRAAVGFIALSAFLVRLLHVLSYDPWPTNDMAVYVDMAVRRLSLANLFTSEGLCWFPPGYSFFLKPFFLALEPAAALRAVQIAQAALGAGTCVLLYRLGTRVHSRRAGLVAALLACFYPHLVFYTSAYMSETLFIFVYLSGLLLFMRRARVPRKGGLFAAGLLAALAILIRPAGATMAPAALLAVWNSAGDRRGRFRSLVLVGLGALALIGPWTARNWIAYGHFVPISPNGPFNLAIGNQPDAKGGYTPPPNISSNLWGRADHYVETASEFVRTDPWGVLFITLSLKWDEFWSFIPPWPLFSSNPLLYYGEHFFPFVPWRLILPAGLAGLGLLIARRRSGWWILPACASSYVALYMLFFGDTRFRIPLECFFLVWSGVTLVHLVTRIPRLRAARSPGWSAAMALVLAFCLVETAWAGAGARRHLASEESLVYSGGRFVLTPEGDGAILTGDRDVALDRARGRFLRLSLQVHRSGPERTTPYSGRLRLFFLDEAGRKVAWKENPTFNLEALPPDRWVTLDLKVHIPPPARSCRLELVPVDSNPDLLIFDRLELRYARGNPLFLESVFPYLRYEE